MAQTQTCLRSKFVAEKDHWFPPWLRYAWLKNMQSPSSLSAFETFLTPFVHSWWILIPSSGTVILPGLSQWRPQCGDPRGTNCASKFVFCRVWKAVQWLINTYQKDHQIHCFSSSVDSTVPNQTEFKLCSSNWEKIQSLAQCRSLPAFFHRNGGRTNHFVGVGVGKMPVISSWCTVQVSIRGLLLRFKVLKAIYFAHHTTLKNSETCDETA